MTSNHCWHRAGVPVFSCHVDASQLWKASTMASKKSPPSPPQELTEFRREADERYGRMSREEVVRDVNERYLEYKKNSKRLDLCIALGALRNKCDAPGQPSFKDVVKAGCSVSYTDAVRYANIGRSPDPETSFADFLAKEAERQENHRNRQKETADPEVALRNAIDKLKNAKWGPEQKLQALGELVDEWGITAAQIGELAKQRAAALVLAEAA
jgi:hypothetical protein